MQRRVSVKKADVMLISALILCLAITVIFGIPGIIPYTDEKLGNLLADALPRLAVSMFLIVLMISRGYSESFKPQWKSKHLIWSIPCFSVAIVNFPFTALLGGKAVIQRWDLLWLFIIKCAAIALIEEIFFRALLVPLFMTRFEKNRHRVLICVICTSALFALMHLVNLFFGAGIGATAMQVGYTFLIGCMLAVMLIRTKNIWLCVGVHFLFDIGGTIVTDIGSGPFQDTVFWILTAVAGVLCAVHIILSLVRMIKEN